MNNLMSITEQVEAMELPSEDLDSVAKAAYVREVFGPDPLFIEAAKKIVRNNIHEEIKFLEWK